MNLTPLDIRRQTFQNKLFGGLDGYEVKAFLEMVADAFETLSRENLGLSDQLKALQEALQQHRNNEKLLQQALVAAQRLAEEIKTNAQHEADLLIKDAEIESHRCLQAAKEKLLSLQQEINDLDRQKRAYVARVRSLVETQLELLHVIEETSGQGREAPAKGARASLSNAK